MTKVRALVLERQQCYLARDAEGIRWAFPDHALIASLGLASAINVPLVAMGQVLGTINLLDAAGRYTDEDVAVVRTRRSSCVMATSSSPSALMARRTGVLGSRARSLTPLISWTSSAALPPPERASPHRPPWRAPSWLHPGESQSGRGAP